MKNNVLIMLKDYYRLPPVKRDLTHVDLKNNGNRVRQDNMAEPIEVIYE